MTACVESEGIIKAGGQFYKLNWNITQHPATSLLCSQLITDHSAVSHRNISRWHRENSLCTHESGNLDYWKQSSGQVIYSRFCNLYKVSDSSDSGTHGDNYPRRWTTPSPSFTHTGINLEGPLINSSKGRESKIIQVLDLYLCAFTASTVISCSSILSDYSSNGFHYGLHLV